jgi:hypothetical protein
MDRILDKAGTLKAISSIQGRSKTMRADIQAAAIGAMTHANDHGDLTLATKLVNAVSVANAGQLRKYVVNHIPCSWIKGKGFKKNKSKLDLNVTDAIDVMWDEFMKVGTTETKYNAKADFNAIKKALECRIVKAEDNDDAEAVLMYKAMLAIAVPAEVELEVLKAA